ncbi:MlaD family protein [Mycobacterium sp. pUA109]
MRTIRPIARVVSIVALGLFSVTVTASCASIRVDALPQPGNSYRDGYAVVIEFANVLNLPDRAKVVMDGTTVGVVEKIVMGESAVEVIARIDPSVQIPSDIHAVLQQATILGDIFVALDRDQESAGQSYALKPNARIPIAQTTSPPQLEDTIANLSNFIASGSIQRIQNTIIGINRVTPVHAQEVREIAQLLSADLVDLSNNIDTVDEWLNGVDGIMKLMDDHIPMFQYWFSEEGMRSIDISTRMGTYLGTIIPSVGSIFLGGYWAVPFLESMGKAMGAIQKSKWAIEGEWLRPWRKLFTDLYLPADKNPVMNIVSVQTGDGQEITENVEDVLRMVGAIP